MKMITKEILERYKLYLVNEEKATATIEKYVRDVAEFSQRGGRQCHFLLRGR